MVFSFWLVVTLRGWGPILKPKCQGEHRAIALNTASSQESESKACIAVFIGFVGAPCLGDPQYSMG